ncbi:SWIM zinc finger family protein [Pyrobaculum aerophilum]|uniref:SWIM zinc finger family protein n=1 Tax=Pyrobaculum aerophilum TaxID=13773 RepID=UPI002FDAD116
MPHPLYAAIEQLKEDFPGKSYSWIKRALLRLGDVKEVREDFYLVEGRRELGDWKPLYQVWLSQREGKWYCTCYFSTFGMRRRRDICTHVAAVMLFRRYKRALEKLQRRRVYVAEAEVECRGRLTANGELYVKPIGRRDLAFFANPRYRVFVISDVRRIVIKCGSYEVAEAEGEEVPLATAKFLAERFYES